jgi:hypothetical protein
MSFVAVAVGAVGEGIAANLLAGAMMGATTTVAGNVIGGRDPFDNIGRGIVLGGLTGGLTPGVKEAFEIGMPAAAGITAFGVNTLATGDLGKGLAAGIGAYGMYGLSENMVTAGGNALVSDANLLAAQQATELSGLESMSNAFGEAGANVGADAVGQATTGAATNVNSFDKLSRGFDAAKTNPSAFFKDNAKNLMYAAGPILADAAVKSNMPTTATRPGAMRRFSYDPYGQIYTPIGNYEVPVKAAGGGLMGMDDGGYSPGQLNFAERSEPVVRMAEGGQTVEDLYKSIGRTPDATGQAFWESAFGKGPVTADQAASFMQSANAVKAQEAAAAPNLITANTTTQATTGGLDTLAAANNIPNVTTSAAALVPQATTPAQSVLPPPTQTSTADAQTAVNNIYRNVLGRDADPVGLNFWSNAIASGRSVDSVYQDILKSANEIKTAGTLGDFGIKTMTAADAAKPYTGFTSTEGSTIADEFVRNVLGREPTAADRTQSWYKEASNLGTTADASKVYSDFLKSAGTEASSNVAKKIADAKALLTSKGLTEADVLRQTGKTVAELVNSGANLNLGFMQAAQLKPLGSASTGFDFSTIKPLVKKDTIIGGGGTDVIADGFYGNDTGNALTRTPGDITTNRDGTKTITPNIPGRPDGGFPGMGSVRDAYTAGGGSLGYIPYAPKTIEEFEAKYGFKTPSGSKQAMDYLTGKTKYSATPFTETGEVMTPYAESVLGRPLDVSTKRVLFDPVTKKYKNNPDYIPVSYTEKGKKVYGLSSRDIAAQLPDLATSDYEKWTKDNNVTLAQIAEALGISLAEAKKRYPKLSGDKTDTTTDNTSTTYDNSGGGMAAGGLAAMASGGMAGQFNLGGYSDGGRLLRGPGDGVSDSIPATIGNKRPARLADGEFVVPARIVSELGNGSTEAGARKLYAMMDRVQRARRGTVGKGRVAKNSRSDKYLPA